MQVLRTLISLRRPQQSVAVPASRPVALDPSLLTKVGGGLPNKYWSEPTDTTALPNKFW